MGETKELWNELRDRMEYHAERAPGDEVENSCAEPAWWADLERYCFLTGQDEATVLVSLQEAAMSRLQDRYAD